MTIRGAGALKTIVDGGGSSRVFDVIGGIDVDFANLTIRNGGGQSNGAGIQALSANLTLKNVLVAGNSALKGGGINDENGNVTMIRSEVSGNFASGGGGGGGISLGLGTLTVILSKINGNTSVDDQGGGVSSAGAVSLSRSVVSNNKAKGGPGGGIMADSSIYKDSNNTACRGGTPLSTVKTNRSSILNNGGVQGGGILQTCILTKSQQGTKPKEVLSRRVAAAFRRYGLAHRLNGRWQHGRRSGGGISAFTHHHVTKPLFPTPAVMSGRPAAPGRTCHSHG